MCALRAGLCNAFSVTTIEGGSALDKRRLDVCNVGMTEETPRYAPGRVRDAIIQVMSFTSDALSVKQIEERVRSVVGPMPASSVRSYLRLNTPDMFVREDRGVYRVRGEYSVVAQRDLFPAQEWQEPVSFGQARLHHADCFDWLGEQEDSSFHAVGSDSRT